MTEHWLSPYVIVSKYFNSLKSVLSCVHRILLFLFCADTGEISSITPLSQTSAVSSLSQDMTASQQQHVITAGYPTQELVTMATPGDGDSQSQSSDVGDGQFKQEGEVKACYS